MMQKLSRLLNLLALISGLIALCFLALFARQFWAFSKLDAQVPATLISLQVKNAPSARFVIEADYSYEVEGVSYRGKTSLENPLFLSRFAAERYLRSLPEQDYIAFFSKKSPALSSLENPFPYKECVQALITLCVFLYFYFARGLLAKFLSQLVKI